MSPLSGLRRGRSHPSGVTPIGVFPESPPIRSAIPSTASREATVLGYGAVLFLYHIPFFVLSHQWLLLIWCTLATGLAIWVDGSGAAQCTRCYHLSCPANRVPDHVRRTFFENYPRVRESVAGERATDKLLSWLGGSLEKRVVEGWGYPLFRPGGSRPPASTMMACPPEEEKTETSCPCEERAFSCVTTANSRS